MINDVLNGKVSLNESLDTYHIANLAQKGNLTIGDIRGYVNNRNLTFVEALMTLVDVFAEDPHILSKYRDSGVVAYISSLFKSVGVNLDSREMYSILMSSNRMSRLSEYVLSDSDNEEIVQAALDHWIEINSVGGEENLISQNAYRYFMTNSTRLAQDLFIDGNDRGEIEIEPED
jgi:hypothetical protein